MIYTDIAGRYFDWLYERVCGDWEPRGLSFHRLLAFLYNQNFTPSCELDGARAEDGLDLRYRFAQTQNIVYKHKRICKDGRAPGSLYHHDCPETGYG